VNFRIRIDEYVDEYGMMQQRLTPEIIKTPQKAVNLKPLKVSKYDTIRYEYFDPQFGRQIITIPQVNPLWERAQARKQKEKQARAVKHLLETDSLQNLRQEGRQS